jgi:Glyoxalase-like domain
MPEPLTFQVTFDARDPHAQARFWAQVLHYEVEDQHDLVSTLLDQGVVGDDDVVEVDGRKAFKVGAGISAPGDGPTGGTHPRVLFMGVPEEKQVKNRVHLDVRVPGSGEDGGMAVLEAEAARLEELGAKELYRHDEADGRWITMADPEGNELCVH